MRRAMKDPVSVKQRVALTLATWHLGEWPVRVMSAVFAMSATSPVDLRLRKDCGNAANGR